MSESDVSFPIIVIDDEPTAVDVLCAHLTRAGHTVLVARDAADVLRRLEAHEARMVIADWSMPDMDGIQLCRAIRSRPEWGYVYFIMVTIHAATARLVEAFEAGVDDFLPKPVQDGELPARVRAGARILRLQSELAAANARLREIALTDELTGLPNRRYAISRLREEWALTDRTGQPLACAMLDLDGLKRVNDRHGHLAGDAALRRVASCLRRLIRTEDVACRIGGDEFLILFPQQDAQGAALVAERCRAAVHDDLGPDGAGPRINLSAGVADKRSDMHRPDDLLQRADAALYAGKRAGGNTVRLAGEPEPAGLSA